MSLTRNDDLMIRARIQEYLDRIRRQESSRRPYILHFDKVTNNLLPWLWPVNEKGERVSPGALATFRAEGFRRPCCLCAVPGLGSSDIEYKETMVYMSVGRQHFGEYMVACASGKCGYKVCIERSYTMPGLPIQIFQNVERVHPMTNKRKDRSARRRPRGIRRQTPSTTESRFSKLLRLDSFAQPGLSEVEFYDLFTMCRQCRWVMTRSAFKHHACPAPEVIEMADDSDIGRVID